MDIYVINISDLYLYTSWRNLYYQSLKCGNIYLYKRRNYVRNDYSAISALSEYHKLFQMCYFDICKCICEFYKILLCPFRQETAVWISLSIYDAISLHYYQCRIFIFIGLFFSNMKCYFWCVLSGGMIIFDIGAVLWKYYLRLRLYQRLRLHRLRDCSISNRIRLSYLKLWSLTCMRTSSLCFHFWVIFKRIKSECLCAVVSFELWTKLLLLNVKSRQRVECRHCCL